VSRHSGYRNRPRPAKPQRAKLNPAHERRRELGRSATLLDVEPERTPDVVDELERDGVLAAARRDAGDEW
jgi:hypothetical protein